MDTLAAVRRWYAEDLPYKVTVLRNPHLIEAVASVPREQFVSPGLWRMISDPYSDAFLTPDTDPRRLYHGVLVTVDVSRNPNDGMPSFWARDMEHLEVARRWRTPGRARTGYSLAVPAEIVGSTGRVTAVEADPCWPHRPGEPRELAAGQCRLEARAGR